MITAKEVKGHCSAGIKISTYQIGIIGCGHLGRTLARVLLDNNFPKENLRVSFGGNPSTLESLKKDGLLDNITNNDEICSRSDIILITMKPQDFAELKQSVFPKQTIVVSCMAGISTDAFKKILSIDVFRIMPSGPDTIQGKKGIVALYPHNDTLVNMLSFMGLTVYEIPNEEILHIFTVGVCLPAGILAARKFKLSIDKAIKVVSDEYPSYRDIYRWALNVLPVFDSAQEQEEYIAKMTTKGGITEAFIDSIYAGDEFLTAIKQARVRSQEIAVRANGLFS
jgi:pyrroline-5-carboxylate reductase